MKPSTVTRRAGEELANASYSTRGVWCPSAVSQLETKCQCSALGLVRAPTVVASRPEPYVPKVGMNNTPGAATVYGQLVNRPGAVTACELNLYSGS